VDQDDELGSSSWSFQHCSEIPEWITKCSPTKDISYKKISMWLLLRYRPAAGHHEAAIVWFKK
jgi:hypothetical protein